MQIKDKIAVITGAASGMGAASAKHLAAAGARVALLDVNEEALAEVAKETGGVAIPCDVTSAEDMQQAFDTIHDKLGLVRICVCCAGVAPAKRMVGRKGPMPLADFAKVININLIGTFNAMRLASADMVEQESLGDSGERGVVINTASVAAYEGQIGQTAYSASKGGVVGMTLPAAREMAQFGVRVMAIAPGLVATPLLLNMPQDVQDSLAASVPFPKRLAQPQEFAELVKFIVENEMMNGSVVRLDGAIRMQPK